MMNEGKHQSMQTAYSLNNKQHSCESVTESACPQCRHINDAGAFFCEECGAGLQKPAICPNCNATARIRADICEICGTWLLKGQCVFCYAHIDDDEIFCGECGNPSKGIICQTCGKLSIFDFCKTCVIPLSAEAKEMLRKTTADPVFQEMVSLFKDVASVDISSAQSEIAPTSITPVPITSAQDDQVKRLKLYREASRELPAEQKPKSVPKTLFSSDQKARISQLNEEVFQEEERRQQEAARQREEERRFQEQLNKAMSNFRGKTFSSSQEARRFFMNMIAGLPEEVARKITNRGMGWRCNAYNCVHDSPGDCADPSRGGVWLIR